MPQITTSITPEMLFSGDKLNILISSVKKEILNEIATESKLDIAELYKEFIPDSDSPYSLSEKTESVKVRFNSKGKKIITLGPDIPTKPTGSILKKPVD
jgi:hypothetical protein